MRDKVDEKQENTSNHNTKQYKIGKTIYNVSIFFSETSKETMEDKLKRLIEHDSKF